MHLIELISIYSKFSLYFRSSKRDSVFEEAKNRLDVLINTNFKSIGKELLNKDGYLYHRAYTAGLQEFIEAYSYYQYLKNEQLEASHAKTHFSYIYLHTFVFYRLTM